MRIGRWLAGPVLLVLGCSAEPTTPFQADAGTEAEIEVDFRDVLAQQHCDGTLLPACSGPYTGPSCTLPCVTESGGADETAEPPGPPPECGFQLYCHSDGSVYGLATTNAFLWEAPPTKADGTIESHLENWLVAHEEDVGLDPGLRLANLGLTRRPDFRSQDGSLTIFRFSQRYRTFPVLPPDGMVTVVYTPGGAISVTGTIVDNRVSYANRTAQASMERAKQAIEYYVNAQTHLPTSAFTIEHLKLVAIPQAQAIGWSGFAKTSNGGSLAHVVVDADLYFVGPILPLWSYRDASHEDLANTQAITSTVMDPQSDPGSPILTLSNETTLTTGAPLLGSIDDVSTEVQLATEAVVVLDLHGQSKDDLQNVATRVLDPNGMFLASSGGELTAQIGHHLVHGWHALIDGYMTDPLVGAKRWDSANPLYSNGVIPPNAASGTFVPRFLVYADSVSADCPTGAVACASVEGYLPAPQEPAATFPEVSHVPVGGTGPEAVGRMSILGASTDVFTIAHEAGHLFDLFVGGGITADLAPSCGGACVAECVEDTTDEAAPLAETIAQLFAMIFLRQSFAPVDFQYCDLLERLGRETPGAHDPGPCVPPGEQVKQFVRASDLACASPAYCDKPETPGFGVQCCYSNEDQSDCGLLSDTVACPPGSTNTQGGVADGSQRAVPTGLCDPSPGYDVYSMMQAFWQLLNGYLCDPVDPFSCETVAWPDGIDPMDAVVPAFLYALRLAPLTYEQLVDGMATYVGCNYGDEVYDVLNKVVCNHGLRECGAPVPALCGTCGNGVREGGEQCDGQDWAITACTDFAIYSGGTLSCHPAGSPEECRLDLSMCQAASADTTVGSDPSAGPGGDVAGDADDGGADSSGSGAADGGGSGCECRARAVGGMQPDPIDLAGLMLLMLLMARGRRRGRVQARLSPLALTLAGACGDDVTVGGSEPGSTATSAITGTAGTTTLGGTSSDDGASSGAPYDLTPWVGRYHFEDPFHPFGQSNELHGSPALMNFEIFADFTATMFYDQCNFDEPIEIAYIIAPENASVLKLLPGEGESSLRFLAGTDLEVLRVTMIEPCRQLTFEFDGMTWGNWGSWHPGEACWVDRCEVSSDRFHIDYCEGEEPPACP